MKVIINADDFGLREGVTNAIADAFERRLITQTTAMVNMPHFNESVKIARDRGFFDKVGLHLNLTFGMPLTEKIRNCRRVCNSDGSFSGEFHRSVVGRLLFSNEEKVAVSEEIEAQMRRFVSTGFTLMHLDSHHHVHSDWGVLRIMLPLARIYGFKTIRLSRNAGTGLTPLKKMYKTIVNDQIKRSFVSTDYFTDVVGFKRISDAIPAGAATEIMTHPTYWQNGDFSRYVPYGDMYDWHTTIDIVESLLAQTAGVELMTFGDLLK